MEREKNNQKPDQIRGLGRFGYLVGNRIFVKRGKKLGFFTKTRNYGKLPSRIVVFSPDIRVNK